MKLRKVLAIGVAAGAVGAFLAPSAAWADTNPNLNQTGQHILANNPGYDGTADCDVAENENQDVWVFVWPGKDQVGEITAVEIGWDSNNPADGTADFFLHLADGVQTTDNGTLKIAFVTPAGYRLETGTSTVTGATSSGKFNLTHTCAGVPEEPCTENCTPDPCEANPQDPVCNPDPCVVEPDDPECNPTETTTTPATTTTTAGGGLPVTGGSLTGLIALGVALVAGGGMTLFFMRRRRAIAGE